MKKKVLATILAVVMASMMVACGGQAAEAPAAEEAAEEEAVEEEPAAEEAAEEPAAEEAAAEEKDSYLIGVSIGNLENEANAIYADAMQEYADSLGNVELIVTDGAGLAENQVSQCEQFITQGVDAVILMPYDAQGCQPAAEACRDAGVPIITSKVEISDQSAVQSYVGANDLDGGIMETQYIADLLGGEGNVVVIEGPTGQSAAMLRMEGTQQVLSENPGMKMLYNQPGNWIREEGMAIMENWLQLGDDIDAVIAHNDEMALGAYDAIVDAGKEDEIAVIGIDAIDGALLSVKEGGMVATVKQENEGIAVEALKVALELAKGNTVDETYYIPFTVIDSNNIDEFLQ